MGVCSVFYTCATTTTMKGVSKVIKAPKYPIKVIWFVGAAFGMAFGLYVVINLFINYFSYSVVVGIEESRSGFPFPDVTVCNVNPLPSDEVIPGIKMTLNEYVDKLGEMAKDPQYNISEEDIYKLKSMGGYLQNVNVAERSDVETDFVRYCTWKSTDFNHIPCKQNQGYWILHGSAEYHTCVTFHTDYKNAENMDSVYAMTAILYLNDFVQTPLKGVHVDAVYTYARGVKVLLHSPNTLPIVTLVGLNLPPGNEATVAFTTERRGRLKYPYGSCTDEEYIQGSGDLYSYSQHGCIEHTNQEAAMKRCNCLNADRMSTKRQHEQMPYCGSIRSFNLTAITENNQCLDGARKEGLEMNEDEMCPEPCVEYRYDTEVSSVPWPHEAYQLEYYDGIIKDTRLDSKFSVYRDIETLMETNRSAAFEKLRTTELMRRNFMQLNVITKMPKLLKKITDKPAITVFALIGTLGGACNLWMGISFITALEICELIYHLGMYFHNEKKKPEDEKPSPADEADKPESTPLPVVQETNA